MSRTKALRNHPTPLSVYYTTVPLMVEPLAAVENIQVPRINLLGGRKRRGGSKKKNAA